jgi:pimeloyl-ACP methyl ester carboxylesterase
MSNACRDDFKAKNIQSPAADWCCAGDYFSWRSTLPENESFGDLDIFYTCLGDPHKPPLLLIHGYPTSSYDFAQLAHALSKDYYVCALDTPGYGFSDKPRGTYTYSLFDDAQLVDYFIREIVKVKPLALLTHDKGNSVGLALLQIYQAHQDKPYTINHHFITNGNIYLPLAKLTRLQALLLHPHSGPIVSSLLTSSLFAKGLGRKTCTPALSKDEVKALKVIFDYQDGIKIQHKLIQYLNERKVNEVSWLEALGRSDIPTTLIWGELDQIAPVAVPDYVWEHYLKDREIPANYWRIPCANHYLQMDHPELLASLVRSLLREEPVDFNLSDAECKPYRFGE